MCSRTIVYFKLGLNWLSLLGFTGYRRHETAPRKSTGSLRYRRRTRVYSRSQKKGTAQGSRLSIAATATPHPPLIPLVTPPHKRSLLCTPAPLPSKSPAQPPRPEACNNHHVAPEAFYLGVLVSHPLVVVRNVLRGAVPVPVAKKEKREQQRLVRKSQDPRTSAAHPTFFGASPL